MNVFDWNGPDFLRFYAVFALVVLGLQVVALALTGSRKPVPGLSDPYLIAHLRGGAVETLRVATITLIDRGLLQAGESEIVTAKEVDLRSVTVPVEQALLAHFEQPKVPASLSKATACLRACERYAAQLAALGLDPARSAQRRWIVSSVALLLLFGVAATKLLLALSRGRTNVLFLLLLAGAACVATRAVAQWRPLDRAGRLLADLRLLLRGLRSRAKALAPGAATSELSLLGAVFGLGAVPLTLFPARDRLFAAAIWQENRAARRRKAEGDDGGWFGSSSCSVSSCGGTSGSGSCGSSCGGGGGGGGCGGCGS